MASIGSSVLPISVDEGVPFYLSGEVDAMPSGTATVLSALVPANKTRNLKQLWVTALNDGHFSLKADGLQIAKGRIDNVAHNVVFKFDPPRPIGAGVLLEVVYDGDGEPTFICPVTAFLSGSDLTI